MKIGVDLGGTRLHVALIKGNRIIKEIRAVHQKKDRGYILNQLVSNIEKLFRQEVDGVGIGIAGIVKEGRLVNMANLPELNGVNLKGIIQKRFRVKTAIENDVNCFALWQGKGHRAENMVCLTLGTGVGGGIIIGGKLYKGMGFGGELGHMVIKEDGIKENSGLQGTLEAYCSGSGIEKRYYMLTKKKKTVIEIGKLKTDEDKKIIKETGKYLGIGLANIVNVLNPEIIVIGGGISNISALFPVARKEMQKRVLKGVKVRVIQNRLKGSTALGAASLV